MIRFEEALAIIKRSSAEMKVERVSLMDALGKVLAEDIFSDMDMPPFDKSAVDGYACRRADLTGTLKVLEVIAAGKSPRYAVTSGCCSKLMTGGMVPEGADCVVMIEDVELLPDEMICYTGKSSSANICYQAEDIRRGSKVLSKGTILRPQEVAVLASTGAALPLVYSGFRIGVITTGDELVEPGEIPGIAQIRNSNAWQLIAQISRTGAMPSYYGIAVDNEQQTLEMIDKAAMENDIVLLTGGISVGDFDFVPSVLEKAGFNIQFRSLAVQPGKPSIFATRQKTYLFALPGNPVSSFVQFELLVRYLMDQCRGVVDAGKWLNLPLGFDFSRKKTERKAFIPVAFQPDGTIGKVEYHGSAHIHSYIHADGIMQVDIGVSELPKGSLVNVRLL